MFAMFCLLLQVELILPTFPPTFPSIFLTSFPSTIILLQCHLLLPFLFINIMFSMFFFYWKSSSSSLPSPPPPPNPLNSWTPNVVKHCSLVVAWPFVAILVHRHHVCYGLSFIVSQARAHPLHPQIFLVVFLNIVECCNVTMWPFIAILFINIMFAMFCLLLQVNPIPPPFPTPQIVLVSIPNVLTLL